MATEPQCLASRTHLHKPYAIRSNDTASLEKCPKVSGDTCWPYTTSYYASLQMEAA